MQDFYRILPQRFAPCKKHAKSSAFTDYGEMFNWFIPSELWGRITKHIKSETRTGPARGHCKFCPQDFVDSHWELIQREVLQTSLNLAKRLIYNWNIWKSTPTALFLLAGRVDLLAEWRGHTWQQERDVGTGRSGRKSFCPTCHYRFEKEAFFPFSGSYLKLKKKKKLHKLQTWMVFL